MTLGYCQCLKFFVLIKTNLFKINKTANRRPDEKKWKSDNLSENLFIFQNVWNYLIQEKELGERVGQFKFAVFYWNISLFAKI